MIKKSISFVLVSAFCFLGASTFVEASSPMGLQSINPVESAGSDARSQDFLQNSLSKVQHVINAHTYTDLFGNPRFNPNLLVRVNMNSLILPSEQSIRAYFISEDANYQNTFGMTTGHDFSLSAGDQATIFANASAPPLQTGDFVDLGVFDKGTKLNFFLGQDTASNPISNTPDEETVWWTNQLKNKDGAQHVFGIAIPNTNLLLMGWEDLSGSLFGLNGDYNDLFVVLEGVATPEPETYLILATFLGFVILIRGNKRQEAKVKS
ncbi:MAG: hypothetical protein CMO81_04360 [Waddliaceae bacterium]|nr:hypothetical protein [Waddliaceae bacterium]